MCDDWEFNSMYAESDRNFCKRSAHSSFIYDKCMSEGRPAFAPDGSQNFAFTPFGRIIFNEPSKLAELLSECQPAMCLDSGPNAGCSFQRTTNCYDEHAQHLLAQQG